MITKLQSDRILAFGKLYEGSVYVENGKILDITHRDLPYDTEWNFKGCYLAPGFIESHCHGGAGYSFLSGAVEDVVTAANFHFSHGVTTICPTLSAAPINQMETALSAVAAAMKSPHTKPHILGAHLEGPYLSPRQNGAQNTNTITPPIPEEYAALAARYGEAIARWTYAPEEDCDGAFGHFLKQKKILASIGHSDATQADVEQAMDAGCHLITHLYSCTSTITRKEGFRRLGIIETAFLHDALSVEIIADGKHLPPDLIKMILKIKGSERVIATTDCLDITGTDITSGMMAGVPFRVEDGVCRLPDRSAFAGSIAATDDILRVLVREVGLSIHQAIKLMSENPAKLLGLPKGILAPGYDADIIALDDTLHVKAVFATEKAPYERVPK